jgi:large subunit ribosomal protein L15
MQLHDLKAPEGANKGRKRVGRGESSGWGKTAGRGGKGQTARTGKGKPGLGFEGGQMPMYRRMPKRGFVNIFRRNIFEINLDMLSQHFESGAEINLEALRTLGLFGRKVEMLRILGRGELAYPLTVHADHFTASARSKIEAAGGQAVDVAPRGTKG